MSKSQRKGFLTAQVFIILPAAVSCVLEAPAVTTTGRLFNKLTNRFFNFNSVGTGFYKSKIECIEACKQRDDCSSVNMKRAATASESDMIECDFQQRATRTEDKLENDNDTTYYCKSICMVTRPQQTPT